MSSKPNLNRWGWPASIRGRLALWYGTILGVAFLFVGLLLFVYLSRNLHSDFDFSLRSTAEALARASLDRSPPSGARHRSPSTTARQPRSHQQFLSALRSPRPLRRRIAQPLQTDLSLDGRGPQQRPSGEIYL
ncbi:MAG: hypothetical protein MPW14_16205 [Candidatus Manganitrophus sp.]|nr:hypothetical protein [Candidatus Manganitrophus sp.]WDT69673.1 MAG: hypothetical protein MPW17_12890 [Candidatus Manganitrophus sp.]WDT78713.1 MAG: hypothetical protein MPW14_16205 [Candidatus Manganitrophus sp.]